MTVAYNSNYHETMPFSDTVAQVNAGANVEQTYTVPGITGSVYQAYFTYTDTANVYVCLNATPVQPSLGTVGTQQYNEFRPVKRYVRAGDVLHFITPDTSARIGVSLRQLQV